MQTYSFSDPVALKESLWPKVVACYSRTWDQFDMPPHFHNRAEVMYMHKGWCKIHMFDYYLDDDQQIRVTRRWLERLSSGEFIFLDQGVLHALEVTEPCYMFNVEFELTMNSSPFMNLRTMSDSSPNMRAFLDQKPRCLRSRDISGQLMRTMENVITNYSNAESKDPALADVLMAELLLRLADMTKDTSIKANVRGYAHKATEYITSHLSEDIRVDDIAKIVGVAPAYLQRTFKQATGVTIVEYINQLRIEHSKQFLMHTEEPIMDVAIASGFNSRQHFFRVFNAMTGMSPQQFRQEYRERHGQQIYIFENVNDIFYDEAGS